jgi:hypothetical protein
MAGNKNSGNRTGRPRAKGAGRKPKDAREHWLAGDAGKRGLALVERPADAGAPKAKRQRGKVRSASGVATIGAGGEVPAELAAGERVFWDRWAPRAKANGTLTDDTTPGLVLLCQTAADAECCRTEIYGRGIVAVRTALKETGNDDEAMEVVTLELKAHPLWTHYRGLKSRLEQLLARYGLASMGRPAEEAAQKEDDERAELRRLMAIK